MMENARALDIAPFLKDGLTQTVTSLGDHFQTQLNSSATCPDGGSEIAENVVEKKGTLLSAMGLIQSALSQAQPTVTAQQADQSRCGSCQQNNVVSSYVTAYPEKTVADSKCNNRPSKTFSKDFNAAKAAQDYSQQILQGQNDDGSSLAGQCPNPCAYYITTAQTALANGATHLTLTVQCGEPRGESIFSATYAFKAGVIHQWSCSQ
jgi:hypothetical protein